MRRKEKKKFKFNNLFLYISQNSFYLFILKLKKYKRNNNFNYFNRRQLSTHFI